MEKTKSILAMIGLVLIGFIGGFFTHQLITKKHFQRVIEGGPRLHDKIANLLDLTTTQKEKLSPILEAHHEQMREIHKGIRQQREDIYQSLEEKLAGELTPEQLEKFKEFRARQPRFHKKKN